MTKHEHVWAKWSIGKGGCQCSLCWEDPEIEVICDDVDCTAVLDPSTPGYAEIAEKAPWF